MDKIIERYPTVPIFRGLEPLQIARLLDHADDVETAVGDMVIEQGKPGDGLFVIGAGIYEVVRESEGKSVVIARLEELSSFGEMSLFEEAVRSASVICKKAGRLKRFSREKFHELLDADDPVAYRVTFNICGLLARRLAAVDDRLVS